MTPTQVNEVLAWADHLGLRNLTEVRTMAVLAAHPESVPIGVLATGVGVHDASMTGIVDRLASINLARRTTSHLDRRSVLVEFAAEGRKAFTK